MAPLAVYCMCSCEHKANVLGPLRICSSSPCRMLYEFQASWYAGVLPPHQTARAAPPIFMIDTGPSILRENEMTQLASVEPNLEHSSHHEGQGTSSRCRLMEDEFCTCWFYSWWLLYIEYIEWTCTCVPAQEKYCPDLLPRAAKAAQNAAFFFSEMQNAAQCMRNAPKTRVQK